MAEEKLVQVDQIEGLGDYIREQVRVAIREEAKPALEDMEEIKKSPAGMLIRLEDKVDALESKMDQRFEAVESKMDQRFEAVDQRFEAVESKMDQRFEAVDQRFIDLKESMDQQFSTMKWALVLIFPFLLTILGKLFLMK